MFAYRIFNAGSVVIVGYVTGVEAFHHVISEPLIAKIVFQIFNVGLDDALHVFALVVEVAATRKVFALIVVRTEADALGVGLFQRVAAVIILADVSAHKLVCDTVVGLGGEIEPSVSLMVIDHNIGHGHDTVFLEGLDHGTQLGFCSETGVVPEVVVRHVPHHLCRLQAFAALRHPYEVDESFHVGGL